MSVIMDNRLSSTDREAEVKKLQALVKELELENEELRSERQTLLSGSGTPVKKASPKHNEKESAELKELATHLETLNPMDMETVPDLSDEETWLVDSPKGKICSQDWLRKDVDDPSLGGVKKALLHKLDYIAVSPYSSPRRMISPCSSSGVLSPDSPPSTQGERNIDTRTFVRQKKKRSLAYRGFVSDENRNSFLRREEEESPSRLATSRESMVGRCGGSLGSEEEDQHSSASEGSFSYRLTDVEDVNAVARLQEESLKFADPSRPSARPSGLRGMGGSYLRKPMQSGLSGGGEGSGGSISSSQEDLLSGIPRRPARGLQPPRHYRAMSGMSGVARRDNQSASREGSDISSPPDSPYNSQHNLESCNGRRLPLGTRLGGSDPRLLGHGTPSSSRGTSPARTEESPSTSQTDLRTPPRASRLQAPQVHSKSRLSAPSPVRIPMPTAGHYGAELRPKTSSIPRPGLRVMKSRGGVGSASSSGSASDWRDGCF